MCGLVFAGSNTMGTRDVDFFERLLYCDIIRGDHSTGVFAGYHHFAGEPYEIRIRKAAVPADVFIRASRKELGRGDSKESLWEEVKVDKRKNPANNTLTVTKHPKFLVGHNRYATMGEIVDSNAHPFQHGAVTLVHNGTLNNQSLLPDHTRFKVDSENVAHAINVEGIEETIKKLNGAYTLIWHDARDNTLNFLRNKDRPFHFAETTTGDWFGASEEDMLMWLMERPKGPTPKRHFEAEVGVQYVFDVSNGGFKFKEERKHELPTFRYVYSGHSGYNSAWYNDYDDDYEERFNRRNPALSTVSNIRSTGSQNQTQGRSQNAEETQKDRLNALLESHGISIKVGEWIFFESFQFDEYPNGSEKGKMTGFMNNDEYTEVQAPGFAKGLYQENGAYRGKIISCYEMNYILHIVVGPAEPRFIPSGNVVTVSDMVQRMVNGESGRVEGGTVFNTPPPEDDEEDEQTVVVTPIPPAVDEDDDQEACAAITASGDLVTKKEWDCNGALNCCANCGSPIAWADAESTEIRQGNAWCQDCAAEIDEHGFPKDGGSERPSFQFKCTSCNYLQHEDLMSCKDNVCVKCYDKNFKANNVRPFPRSEPAREVLSLRRKLQNGMSVNKAQWAKMCACNFCNQEIPWGKAHKTVFIGQRVTCDECDAKLEMGMLPFPVKR